MPDAPRWLVVRLGSLGDLVHTLPAVAALHRARPDVAIDWLVDRVHDAFLALVPMLASRVVLERPTIGGWLDARRALRQRRYDAAIDFQGLLKSAALARLSGASRVAGFDRASLREPAAAWFYTEQADGSARHVIDKNLALAARFGAAGAPYEFPIGDVASRVADEVAAAGTPFAILNCGAAWPNKRWPADRFGQLASWLRAQHGLRSIALWGPGEAEIAAEIARTSGGAASAAPQTTVPDLVALCRRAALVVSGDTGPTHIAAAVGAPVVAIFGPTDPQRNGPWDARDRVASRYAPCECHYERVCRRGADRACLLDISVEEVRRLVDARLAGRAT